MTFKGVLEDIGGQLGTTPEDVGGAAAVEVDGMTVVIQDAGDILLLRAEVGAINEEKKPALLEAAMEANYLYQGTGGATLAVNPANGALHLEKYNWMDRIEEGKVLDVISRFVDTANRWRRILADVETGAPVEQPQEQSFDGGFMRV